MLTSAADAAAALATTPRAGQPADRRAQRETAGRDGAAGPAGAPADADAGPGFGPDPVGRSGRSRGSARSTPSARPRRTDGARHDAPPPDPAAEQPPGDPETTARVICLRLLDRRARSRAELADALERRGVPDDAAQRVLDRLTEVGLVDDAALAGSMAGAQHRERGLSRRAVAVRLRRRGFDDEVVDAAVEGIDAEGDRTRAEALVAKRRRALAGLPTEVQARRLVGLLARKGYSAGLAYSVVRAELTALDASTDPSADLAADLSVEDVLDAPE